MNKTSFEQPTLIIESAECFYHTRNTRIQYIGDIFCHSPLPSTSAAILRAKQEANDKQKKLAVLKAEKEAVDATAEKKKKDDLKEEKRLQKEQKKAEKAAKAMDTVGSKKGKAAAKAVESTLVNEE
ncbi:hypothetical protein ARMSODRAFT_1012818 [Armillaria solidipes]|uniref:Uncharacterized protein n=1 Tax=Armillaria solidipes TaxID=1076256 RepID=A0A2H3CAK9_9AGAR|nr:hypothetical protein ARMSODRAFT_1012818 [Armillaria solidipes]